MDGYGKDDDDDDDDEEDDVHVEFLCMFVQLSSGSVGSYIPS